MAYKAAGDDVRVITFNGFERALPLPLRHAVFFLRAFNASGWAESILLLDPASTGPALALLASLRGRRTVLRIGGDFLWESYIERTHESILLSEFYTAPRELSRRERLIKKATEYTMKRVSLIVFTTEWQRALWEKPYGLDISKTRVIENGLPSREPSPATSLTFLCAQRASRVKNAEVVPIAWEQVKKTHPEAILDTKERSPAAYRAALASCYAVILPSLSEVSPNAIYEAIRFGKPFITTKDTGVYKSFHDLGEFVDTRSPDAIGQAILRLLDPDTYKAIQERQKAFTFVRNWSAVALDFKNVLIVT
jgi:hypothetical protein